MKAVEKGSIFDISQIILLLSHSVYRNIVVWTVKYTMI